ncbi:MAG TPA: hypothetical protein VJC18_08990, partial [bacterium]|nr:hypothetical protein [bacterium]
LVRLGEKIHENGFFLPEAMNRALAVLLDFKSLIKKHNCRKVRVVATAGCRGAVNAPAFIQDVRQQTGLSIEIISGEEEASLTHLACKTDFAHLGLPLMVLDIGGGSTEIILDDGKQVIKKSFPFGVVTLTEKFFHHDPPENNEIERCREYIKDNFWKFLPDLGPWTPALSDLSRLLSREAEGLDFGLNLVAPAGTPTTLCAISKNLLEYDSSQVHGTQMAKTEVVKITKKLEALSFNERCLIPCLPPKRADVIIAGGHILDVVMGFFGLTHFTVSDQGLAFGIIYQLLSKTSIP